MKINLVKKLFSKEIDTSERSNIRFIQENDIRSLQKRKERLTKSMLQFKQLNKKFPSALYNHQNVNAYKPVNTVFVFKETSPKKQKTKQFQFQFPEIKKTANESLRLPVNKSLQESFNFQPMNDKKEKENICAMKKTNYHSNKKPILYLDEKSTPSIANIDSSPKESPNNPIKQIQSSEARPSKKSKTHQFFLTNVLNRTDYKAKNHNEVYQVNPTEPNFTQSSKDKCRVIIEPLDEVKTPAKNRTIVGLKYPAQVNSFEISPYNEIIPELDLKMALSPEQQMTDVEIPKTADKRKIIFQEIYNIDDQFKQRVKLAKGNKALPLLDYQNNLMLILSENVSKENLRALSTGLKKIRDTADTFFFVPPVDYEETSNGGNPNPEIRQLEAKARKYKRATMKRESAIDRISQYLPEAVVKKFQEVFRNPV